MRKNWMRNVRWKVDPAAVAGADPAPAGTAQAPAGGANLSPDIKAAIEAAVKAALEPLAQVAQRRTPAAGDPNPDVQVRTVAPDTKPEKGIRLARAIRALAASRGDLRAAAYHAEHRFHDPVVAKALAEGSGASGGFLVPQEFSREIIEMLMSQAVVRRSGATVLPMNSNVLNIPRLASGAQATYIGENTNIVKTEPTFEQIQLSAKKLAALVPISNDLIRDSSPAADAVVRNDLVNALALREDLAFLRDDGTSNKPKGILNWVNASNKFNANATINTANVIADLGKARRLVIASNARMVRPCWYISARTEGFLMTLTDANSNFVFRSEMIQGKLLGYPYFVSTQIPENLGAGTNESEVYFGDAVDAVIGENEQLIVDVSTEAAYHDGTNVVAAFSLDQTVIRAIARHDFALRHDKSYSVIQAVKWA